MISGDDCFKLLDEKKYILFYFTASWCGPCKLVSPVIQRIGEEKDSVIVLKVDVDECEEVSAPLEVQVQRPGEAGLGLEEGRLVLGEAHRESSNFSGERCV